MKNSREISRDAHAGRSGAHKENIQYILNAPEPRQGATYTVKANPKGPEAGIPTEQCILKRHKNAAPPHAKKRRDLAQGPLYSGKRDIPSAASCFTDRSFSVSSASQGAGCFPAGEAAPFHQAARNCPSKPERLAPKAGLTQQSSGGRRLRTSGA